MGIDRNGGVSAYIVLLRGINVGGKNVLPMGELVSMLEEAGCAQVRTYIQSGNAVFSGSPAVAQRVMRQLPRSILDRRGLRVPVVLRSADEMQRIAATNPYLKSGAKPETLHVAFLADAPDRRSIASLDQARSPGDSFTVIGAEIYLHLPNGVAGTKLSNDYFDRALKTTSTMRNWRTVLKLRDMMKEFGNAATPGKPVKQRSNAAGPVARSAPRSRRASPGGR